METGIGTVASGCLVGLAVGVGLRMAVEGDLVGTDVTVTGTVGVGVSIGVGGEGLVNSGLNRKVKL